MKFRLLQGNTKGREGKRVRQAAENSPGRVKNVDAVNEILGHQPNLAFFRVTRIS